MPVYKDKKRNTWYVSTYVEYRDGTRKRIMKRGFKTKREATAYENELQFEARINTSENPFVDDIIDEYMEYQEQRVKVSTFNRLESTVRLYIRPSFANKRVRSIVNKDITDIHNKLLDKLSVSTVKSVHKDLSAFFNYCIRMQYINTNPAAEVGNVTAKENKNINYWTLDEFKRFLTVVKCEKYKTFFMLMFYSGMRIGEALALTWADIDFINGKVSINKRYYEGIIDTPKNKSSVRVIKLPNHTLTQLKKFKNINNPKLDYVIFGNFYKPHNQSSINQRFYLYLDKFIVDGKQTLKRIRIHDLRHSHVSYLINLKVDIGVISKRLGHNKTSTTLDIYSHIYPNKEDEAIDLMEGDFKSKKIKNTP